MDQSVIEFTKNENTWPGPVSKVGCLLQCLLFVVIIMYKLSDKSAKSAKNVIFRTLSYFILLHCALNLMLHSKLNYLTSFFFSLFDLIIHPIFYF